jgi:hypothetical protein
MAVARIISGNKDYSRTADYSRPALSESRRRQGRGLLALGLARRSHHYVEFGAHFVDPSFRHHSKICKGSEWSNNAEAQLLLREGKTGEALKRLHQLPDSAFFQPRILEACYTRPRPPNLSQAMEKREREVLAYRDLEPKYGFAGNYNACSGNAGTARMLKSAIEGGYCTYDFLRLDPLFAAFRKSSEYPAVLAQAKQCRDRFLAERDRPQQSYRPVDTALAFAQGIVCRDELSVGEPAAGLHFRGEIGVHQRSSPIRSRAYLHGGDSQRSAQVRACKISAVCLRSPQNSAREAGSSQIRFFQIRVKENSALALCPGQAGFIEFRRGEIRLLEYGKGKAGVFEPGVAHIRP